MTDVEQSDLIALTVQLLSAYVSNNTVPSEQLASLIETTRSALGGKTEPAPEPEPEFSPAVTVRKSLGSKQHILSMIDGKPYKTLKRHLANNGLTPVEYRERYGLAKNYPMVAPAYSEARREVAQRLGLGQRGAKRRAELAAKAADTVSAVEPIPTAPTKPPRVLKTKVTPNSATKAAKVTPIEAALTIEADIPAAATPIARTRKPKAAAAKPAGAKPPRAEASPAESTPPAKPAVASTRSDAPAKAARTVRRSKAETAQSKPPAPKRRRNAPAVAAASTKTVAGRSKRAAKKAAEPAA